MDMIDSLKVKDITKTNYKNKYKKCVEYDIIIEDTEQNIQQKLNNIEATPSTILAYLNICIVLRNAKKLSVDYLKIYRDILKKDLEDGQTYTNQKMEKLPNVAELMDYVSDLYSKNKYKKCIVNILLLTVSCRNKDLNLIVTSENIIVKGFNYLCVRNDEEVVFNRDDYKTSETYGNLTVVIKSKLLADCCKKYLGNQTEKFLFESKEGSRVNNISRQVVDCTYNRLGQSRYMKIKMKESSKQQLLKLSKMRGTNVNTLLNYYDLDKI